MKLVKVDVISPFFQLIESSDIPVFKTYEDHRMAMAFAPLALLMPIEIEEPMVVIKSYPDFWTDFQHLGLTIND
jgi:3-phosphoshikimate 1-carboxyvinyltransferase